MRRKNIVLLSLLGASLAAALAFLWLYLAAIGSFSIRETGPVAEGCYAVADGFVDVYALEKDGAYIVIDAGADAARLALELAKLGIDPAAVRAVLLTHSDLDHVAGIGLFPNATVYISEEEEAMLDGRVHRALGFIDNKLGPHGRLADGSITDIAGFSVLAIVTPGHTAGSACYAVDGRYLFTGDTLGIEGWKPTHFADFFNMDTKTQLASIARIEAYIQTHIVCTAHDGVLFPGR